MSRFHFLNVKNGDCSIIEHNSGHVSIIDVCNARLEEEATDASEKASLLLESYALFAETKARKNYAQKAYPTNPISHLKKFGIKDVFRLAITHPDMDHMDGLTDLFSYASITNYYDTANNKEMSTGWSGSPYREEDWKLYKELRDSPPSKNPNGLRIYSDDIGAHRNRDWDNEPPGDAFHTLSPTPQLVRLANESGDFNDTSYVFLYRSPTGRILLSGDSHDKTWDHILANHESAVKDVDLLIAPHHGRKSGRSYKFLDTVNPKMTFFGNALSKDLAYSAWRNRGLEYITNNMAGDMIVDGDNNLALHVTNEAYARDENSGTYFSQSHQAWYVKNITK